MNQETGILCFHRLRIVGRHHVCHHCGVLIEQCPCVQYRVVDGKCPCCIGSGWVSVIRGAHAKFLEYVSRH